MTAIQYINDYYIKLSLKHFDKEEEFVNRCMENLNEASASLNQNQDSALLVIQRGLLLLKTHLESFRKRYAYHFRKWHLEGNGITSHSGNYAGNHVGGSGIGNNTASASSSASPEKYSLRLLLERAGGTEKMALEMTSADSMA